MNILQRHGWETSQGKRVLKSLTIYGKGIQKWNQRISMSFSAAAHALKKDPKKWSASYFSTILGLGMGLNKTDTFYFNHFNQLDPVNMQGLVIECWDKACYGINIQEINLKEPKLDNESIIAKIKAALQIFRVLPSQTALITVDDIIVALIKRDKCLYVFDPNPIIYETQSLTEFSIDSLDEDVVNYVHTIIHANPTLLQDESAATGVVWSIELTLANPNDSDSEDSGNRKASKDGYEVNTTTVETITGQKQTTHEAEYYKIVKKHTNIKEVRDTNMNF